MYHLMCWCNDPPPMEKQKRWPIFVGGEKLVNAANYRREAPSEGFFPCPPPPPPSPGLRLKEVMPPPPPPPCVTFCRVAVSLRGPGQSPVLPFVCCVGSLPSDGRGGRCSLLSRFRVSGAQ